MPRKHYAVDSILLLEEMRTAVSLSAPNGKLWFRYNEVSKTAYSLRSF